jgi:hypothetical protein
MKVCEPYIKRDNRDLESPLLDEKSNDGLLAKSGSSCAFFTESIAILPAK